MSDADPVRLYVSDPGALVDLSPEFMKRIEMLERSLSLHKDEQLLQFGRWNQWRESVIEMMSSFVDYMHNCNKSLEKLEEMVKAFLDHDERIHDLENIEAETRLLKLETPHEDRPNKCPFCDGKGIAAG